MRTPETHEEVMALLQRIIDKVNGGEVVAGDMVVTGWNYSEDAVSGDIVGGRDIIAPDGDFPKDWKAFVLEVRMEGGGTDVGHGSSTDVV
jgi:hypothetical protein